MKVTAPRLVPVSFCFPAEEGRHDGWGRFERLHPLGGRLATRFRLEEADRVFLSFEAAGESFARTPARVERSSRDEDGYFLAELRLDDEVAARRLASALRAVVIRAQGAES